MRCGRNIYFVLTVIDCWEDLSSGEYLHIEAEDRKISSQGNEVCTGMSRSDGSDCKLSQRNHGALGMSTGPYIGTIPSISILR